MIERYPLLTTMVLIVILLLLTVVVLQGRTIYQMRQKINAQAKQLVDNQKAYETGLTNVALAASKQCTAEKLPPPKGKR